jgi:hypothetical protein
MITLIAAGVGLLVLVAIVVGIVEAAQAPTWRQIAAERRARWEAAYSGSQSYDDTYDESWDDD